MKIKIDIIHADVMALAEGMSVTLAQHAADEQHDFRKLWASASDTPKLDISYREAMTTLELTLHKSVRATRVYQAVLTAQGDCVLTLDVHDYWNRELKGLLVNKINEYVAHSVFAGWLNTFPGLTETQTYVGMAEADLVDILTILDQRILAFFEDSRQKDKDIPTDESASKAGERHDEGDKKTDPDEGDTAGERHDKNDADEGEDESASKAGERSTDDAHVHHHRDSFDLSGENLRMIKCRKGEQTIFK